MQRLRLSFIFFVLHAFSLLDAIQSGTLYP